MSTQIWLVLNGQMLAQYNGNTCIMTKWTSVRTHTERGTHLYIGVDRICCV